MSNIYLITRGSYSDYEIVGAFSTREKAEKLVQEQEEKGNNEYNGGCQVEEFSIDTIQPKEKYCYYCNANHDGDITYTRTDVFSDYISQDIEKVMYTSPKDYGTISRQGSYGISVLARDYEHARKIAADKVREFRVLNNH